MKSIALTRRRLYEIWLNNEKLSDAERIRIIVKKITSDLSDGVTVDTGHLTAYVKHLVYNIRRKWNSLLRKRSRFEHTCKDWLDSKITLILSPKRVTTNIINRGGRPKKLFEEVCSRTKRTKVTALRNLGSAQVLALATEMNARQEGKEDAAKLVHEAMQKSPSRPSQIRRFLQEQDSQKKPLNNTDDEALSLALECDLSKNHYKLLRQNAAAHNLSHLYPSYEKIKEAKERCLPEGITVTEKCAEVPLQALLDHTASRLITLQADVILSCGSPDKIDLTLESKWGFDGSSGQARYKQKYTEDNTVDDSSILITSLVPLQLKVSDGQVAWFNIRSSSTRLCRPIRLQFEKESVGISIGEYENIKEQIEKLVPTVVQLNSITVTVTHSLHCTMIDGKVCSALTGISVQRCVVCGSYPREFNNLPLMRTKVPNKETYQFGISPLHAYIRFMECALHIAYRVEFKCTEARAAEHKGVMRARQKGIQNAFKEKTGLLIDLPKQGSGTTNDGNTARRFFEDPAQTALITGLNAELLERFSIILKTLNSGFLINTEAFRELCCITAECYVANYGWYKMPPAVHCVLFHAADIIDHFKVPIGTLSEEPQESRNKDIKAFRERRSRKCSSLATMTDVFRRLLVSSDVIISSFRKPPQSKSRSLSQDVRKLLRAPQPSLKGPEPQEITDTDESDEM